MSSLKDMGRWLWKNKFKMGILIVVIGGGFYYWQQKKAKTTEVNKIKTAIIERGDIEVLVSGSGQVEAASRVDLKPQVAGDGTDITEVLVQNYQEVKKDDVIAVLDTEDALKLVRNAKLSLQSSQIKQKQVDDESYRKTEEDKWKRQLQEAEIQQKTNSLTDSYDKLEEYYIRAPFDGIVTGLDVEAGDSVARDEILASVITKEMVAQVSLNEIDSVKVEKGAFAKLTFNALEGVVVEGEVTKMDTIGNVTQGVVTYDAEIAFDIGNAPGLKPGMSVEAEIVIESRDDVLSVPMSAIQSSKKGKSFVMVAPEDFSFDEMVKKIAEQKGAEGKNIFEELRKVSVEVGISDDVKVEISGELAEGETVLSQSMTSLRNFTGIAKKDDGEKSKSLIPMGRGMGGKKK